MTVLDLDCSEYDEAFIGTCQNEIGDGKINEDGPLKSGEGKKNQYLFEATHAK